VTDRPGAIGNVAEERNESIRCTMAGGKLAAVAGKVNAVTRERRAAGVEACAVLVKVLGPSRPVRFGA